MKLARRLTSAVTLTSLLCCSSWVTAAVRHPKPADLGSLGGFVSSNNNSPVPDATVRVWRDGKDAATVHVEPTGQFHLPLPDGTYEAQATAPHFRPAITARITVVVHAQHETWVNLDLVPAP